MNYCAWSAVFRVRINFKRIRILHFLYLTYLTCFNDFFNFFCITSSVVEPFHFGPAPAPDSQDGGSGSS